MIKKNLRSFPFWISLLTLFLLIFDLGFNQNPSLQQFFNAVYDFTLSVGIVATIGRYVKRERFKTSVLIFDVVSVLFLIFLLLDSLIFEDFWKASRGWLYFALILVFIREYSNIEIDFKRSVINPAQLFILSFLFLIVIGTLFLLLPNATHQGIAPLDALFTATSAVCVTGLSVVDTGTHFTRFGHILLIGLMQVGGLGIMTFVSYFSYFFRGTTSYENHLALKDMTSTERIGDVFNVLKKIILVTFTIEVVGGAMIYFSLNSEVMPSLRERLFFAIFHGVSAFCNAGFSTLPNGLYEPIIRYNYALHLAVAFLLIMGGIGFPIMFNLVRYGRYFFVNLFLKVTKRRRPVHRTWILNLSSRIILITTASLVVGGTVIFYIEEYHNTLAEHQGLGKVVAAFFAAVTPRTAGFNNINLADMKFSTTMIIFLLMWIGASPASTGGGIKTSTFAIATLNFLSIAKGKSRIEVYQREISDTTIRRAFAVISLSLVVIGGGVFLISIFDSDKNLLQIAFESFSAYSTVGLSLGITASLSQSSKLVLIALMFIGRVSTLSLLIAFLPKVQHQSYRYPTEEILIN